MACYVEKRLTKLQGKIKDRYVKLFDREPDIVNRKRDTDGARL